MFATCTGAKAGASWTTIRPPLLRSRISRSSAGILFQALAGAEATISLGVGSFAGAAAVRASVRTSNGAFISAVNQIRHSRESGNLVFSASPGSRVRGDDEE